MLTNRENALIALSGGKPESVPCAYAASQFICPDWMQEAPPMFSGPGPDGYGVHQTPTESAAGMYTPTAGIDPILEDVTEWEDVVHFPDYGKVDFAEEFKKDSQIFHLDPANRVQDFYCPNGMFERLHFLMGFEEAVMALITDPEAVSDLAGKIADTKIIIAENAAKYYKPDYFTMLDDYAFANGLFMSIDCFRNIFKPHYKRVVDAVHSFGMKFKAHCCGKMESLLDDYLEMGVDALDPVQHLNDIPAMKQKTLHRAGLMGGLNVQGVLDLENVTEEQIRAEVRRCIDEYAADGGYMVFGTSLYMYTPSAYAPGQSIGIVIDECEKYGRNYYA